jgi:uncharacterized damage-inducible protein DinB
VTVEDLELLYDYGYWANKKLFDVISKIPPGQFTQAVGGSFGSIRNTLVHTMSAEAGWMERCGGAKRGPKLEPDDFPTVASVIEHWKKVEAGVRDFIAHLIDDDLLRDVQYPGARSGTVTMPIGELMQHAAAHAVHHRGQVAMLLRMLGHAPGNFDMLFFFEEKHGKPAW